MNILMVASIFRLRRRFGQSNTYRMPMYPLLPLIFILVMSAFLIAALVFNPIDSMIGIALTLVGVPVYKTLSREVEDDLTAITAMPTSNFASVFPRPKPVIGMIHLPPLPDYPDSPGMDAIIASALKDLRVLQSQNFDGVLIENEYDRPYRAHASPETVGAMTVITRAVIAESKNTVVGCEILLNDPKASLIVAKDSGARFIRSDYFVDPMMRPEHGEFEIDPRGLMKYRSDLGADDVLVLADIQVKYARMLIERSIAESARLACNHHADAIIVTGGATGDAPAVEQIRRAAESVEKSILQVPVLIGSGLDAENVSTLLSVADGAIVGTSLMKDRVVDQDAAKRLMSEVRRLRQA
jgi:hypothetical protein